MSESQSTELKKILVVDDEISIQEILSEMLIHEGYPCNTAGGVDEAMELIKADQYALVITDLKMPGKDGLQLLREVQEYDSDISVVLITGKGSVETAVQAMKTGAYDYVQKPDDISRIPVIAARALEYESLKRQLSRMQAEMKSRYSFSSLVGKSTPMQHIYDVIERVAESEATVLIQGESGTGKDVIANAVHYNSLRANTSLIKVDCGALAENLLESELFGHEKGAFTTAIKQKTGRFELADGGTLFLDEIGNMSPGLQQKLLTVIQDREFQRVGGTRTIKVDVRILAATSKNLEQAVENGSFREDLFYRLNVVNIELPPLRDRSDDIPVLAAHFLKIFSDKNKRKIKKFSTEAFRLLMEYHWPGNVRELENTIEYAVVMCRGDSIDIGDLPTRIKSRKEHIPQTYSLNENEKLLIVEVLKKTNGNIKRAAELLEVSRTTLYSKMKKHGLEK